MKTLFETSAGGIVYKITNGEVLWLVIQHKGQRDWRFPKGHIGDTIAQETETAAAVREVKEETGIDAMIVSPTPIHTYYEFRDKSTLHKKTVNYYLMSYQGGEIKLHEKETRAAKFVPQETVLKTATYKDERIAFQKALQLFSEVVRNPA